MVPGLQTYTNLYKLTAGGKLEHTNPTVTQLLPNLTSTPSRAFRLGEQDAIPALLHLIEKHGFGNLDKSEPFVRAVEAACRALGSLLLHGVNQFIMRDLWGLKTMVG